MPSPETIALNHLENAVTKLSDSSKRLETLTEKLVLSTESLSTSSKKLEWLTDILIFLTFFLALLAIIELFLKDPSIKTDVVIGILIIIALLAVFGKRINPLLRNIKKIFFF